MKMDIDEVFDILQQYLKNRLFDHANLYFNGVCGADEFMDHRLDMEYKYAVAQIIWARFQIQESDNEEEKVLRRLYYPGLKTKKRAQRKRRAVINPYPGNFSGEEDEPLMETNSDQLNTCSEKKKLGYTTKEASGKGFRLTLGGSTIIPVGKIEKPRTLNKDPHREEGEGSPINKRIKNQETQGMMESLLENVQEALLKEYLQKEPVTEENPVQSNTICLETGHAVPVINKQLNTTYCTTTTTIESEKSMSDSYKNKQGEILPSSYAAPNRLRIGGCAPFSFNVQPEKHLPEKRLRIKGEDEDSQINKKMKKQGVQVPIKPVMENNPALLEERLQKNNAVLVIEKLLTKTDVGAVQGRLSIPMSQVANTNFLDEEEIDKLENKIKVEARLIDPSGEEWDIKLSKWLSGKSSWQYNLVSPWYNVVLKNNLQEHTPIELYSFREGTQLYFALIKV